MDTNHTPASPPIYLARPSTAGLIELHVYHVPDDVWNPRLNKVPIEAIGSFISMGFIRAPPDMKLRTLRERLGEFLGEDAAIDKFSFLKCVGRSLAVVKGKQELELKVKSFAPPQASQPELYLLPGVESEGSSYGSSVTPEGQRYNVDRSGFGVALPRQNVPPWDQSPPVTESHEKTPRAAPREEDTSFISNRGQAEATAPYQGLSTEKRGTDRDQISIVRRVKDGGRVSHVTEKPPAAGSAESDSGISEAFHGPDVGNEPRKRAEQAVPADETQLGASRALPKPARYRSPPTPPPPLAFPPIQSPPPVIPEPEETLLRQLEKMREERLKLEKSREELLKKTKSLLEQYKLRRHQVRDSWKKKYFETKKETSSLEDTVKRLRVDLENSYQRLLAQLAARDGRRRAKHPALADGSKNSVIMTITNRQQELDQLRRHVENARIKLLIEIKMRKQAASDLNVLKAQLAQKKAQLATAAPSVFAM
ncbi:spermatogenesis-associated protein 1 [Spea bombifrons]|uniref:spermatogenesis-associated protein 1 n=1 Tax=Spea bombifrons TaxID=233779 RepID=UPI00234A6149|nr:spermatogenesis-associated protein 1 [Spea bombifrons]